jgi:mono/diheme cytochrome c family protein
MNRFAAVMVSMAAILVTTALLALYPTGCTELADPLHRSGGDGSQNCVSCHTNQAILEATAEPDTTQEEPQGEG